jgi:NADH dehydrogenase [ubiquinone] 1 alpha subcomplex assembly factor 1
MHPNDDQVRCRRLTDFDSDDANQRWTVVNDDVMGGQSLGRVSFDAGILTFEGEINTDGGGFSSLRLPIEPHALSRHDRIEFRARPDDRAYMVTFDDNIASRDRRVSHRAPIEFGAPGEWKTVSVSFGNLFPAVFGKPVDDLPFRKDLATRMGLMISDGVDGPFRLEIDWIDLCPH